jgi:transcriptional regulator with XRE-family HTH domain
MDWATYIREYRRNRGLKQADFAAIVGVEQATVSRWETGTLRPGLATQRRLRDLGAAYNGRADRAIIASVRVAGTIASLMQLDEKRYVTVSEGLCRLNGASHAAILELSFLETISERAREALADRGLLAALFGRELAAIRITDAVPRVGGGPPHVMSTTVSPLWLSDGSALAREDCVRIDPRAFAGAEIQYIRHEDLA